MTGTADNCDTYYADKLWNLLPEIYRTLDTDEFDPALAQPGTTVAERRAANGPLRELINRIGAQAAIVRRSIDRMWDDQSIETCDDWLIPYIGDLLGTRIVSALDPHGQRLDVAKTIYFRRRKGTLAILEEIAFSITGWDAKLVEFFRRLGRTRHGIDPEIGLAFASGDDVSRLQRAEGLVAAASRTAIGGFADLRNEVAARQAHTAFDEFFHTADFRQGQGYFGRYAISHLGVFLWRLMSLAVGPVTPVPVANCPGWYGFDPTGRNIPLFSPGRAAGAFGDQWKTPNEGQVPGPISQALLDSDLGLGDKGLQLYPKALSVAVSLLSPPPRQDTIDANRLTLRPERGQFFYQATAPVENSKLVCFYRYGFPSEIGAGPYDRRSGTLHAPAPDAGVPPSASPLSVSASSPVTLNHSLTWPGADDAAVGRELVIQAGNHQRPVLRFNSGKSWTLTGSKGSSLVLDGLLITGTDIVLAGSFDQVVISCCTLDPGSAAPNLKVPNDSEASSPPLSIIEAAADGRELVPTRLWIEATIGTILVDRSIMGPIRTRNGGLVERLNISNSIVQGIRSSGFGPIEPQEVKDPVRFERRLQIALDPVSRLLQSYAPEIVTTLGGGASPPFAASPPSESALPQALGLLDALTSGPPLWDAQAFAHVPLSASTKGRLDKSDGLGPAPVLNRLLLEDAYPLELADAAIALADGEVRLSRCTILGRIVVHRIDASECILQQLAEVDDIQHGCVRFSAWADGSVLPRKYECVRIPQGAPLFTSTDFGQPGYAQLLPLADAQILPKATKDERQNTISAGAEDGSEMGAFARDKNPIKQRALLLKFLEYMPAGLSPVIIPVT
ncbi:hypothetical protein XI09_05255 [Bradyrhizobium sp. CCBAU 11386]|uniref:hypothetical protein n=1 Tax=Bradyrhizobium sp. CCBAU 11386 TaxID=1630837 RepID=UPI002302E7C9|nr:hypothetical protein [Bradyrhizobium sp. CCBAU 11386]MDA9504179.1 hypothetical protein [Bradyrhizobium sp. CCBAU 11386]